MTKSGVYTIIGFIVVIGGIIAWAILGSQDHKVRSAFDEQAREQLKWEPDKAEFSDVKVDIDDPGDPVMADVTGTVKAYNGYGTASKSGFEATMYYHKGKWELDSFSIDSDQEIDDSGY